MATKTAKKKTHTKTKAKNSARPKSAKSAKAAPVKKATSESKRGFMWRLLESKQKELKAKHENPVHRESAVSSTPTLHSAVGYARHNGPRRKAG